MQQRTSVQGAKKGFALPQVPKILVYIVGFIPAALSPQQQRPYLWIFGVGVKLVAASLFARLWFAGLAGWLTGGLALIDGALAVLIMMALLKPTKM